MTEREFKEYLIYEKRFSTHTVEAYLNDIAQFSEFINDLGVEHLYSAQVQHVRLWIVSQVEQKLGSATLHRKLSSLNTFYKYSLRKGKTDKNPASGIQLPKLPHRLPKYIEQDTLNQLIEELDTPCLDFSPMRKRVVFELLYTTGMRRQELIALKWPEVNFLTQQIKVFGKGGKERYIPVSKEFVTLLENYLSVCKSTFKKFDTKGYLILTDKGKQAYPGLIYRIINRGLKSANVKTQKSPHVLRHSFATHLLNQGAPLNDIKELLGHASLASTQVYTHNSIEKLKEVFKRSHPKA